MTKGITLSKVTNITKPTPMESKKIHREFIGKDPNKTSEAWHNQNFLPLNAQNFQIQRDSYQIKLGGACKYKRHKSPNQNMFYNYIEYYHVQGEESPL